MQRERGGAATVELVEENVVNDEGGENGLHEKDQKDAYGDP